MYEVVESHANTSPYKFITQTDIVFKGKRRLKICHWVLIGAMGPTDIGSSVLYPHHPSGGGEGLTILIMQILSQH